MELLGHVMNYDWGKDGLNSVVAQLAALNDKEFKVTSNKSYAELWMGDHVSGPAKIKENRQEIGQVITNKLSFLLKVLSIKKALSIQVHPNKKEAEKLHRERPDIYKDPNHKPELAIALTPFVALCGFRPYREIYNICSDIQPLKDIIGVKNLELLKEENPDSIKTVFKIINYASRKLVSQCLIDINTEYREELKKYGILDVFENLNRDFPGDIGILTLFFLNLIHLNPGQSIYLGANVIHAYLSGDCIECMACSDNVIRAGLTPKYRDVEQLLSSLNYTSTSVDDNIFKPLLFDEYKSIFAPPVEDFAVVRIKLPLHVTEYSTDYKPTDSILIVVHGAAILKYTSEKEGITLKRGSIYYIPPSAAPKITLKPIEYKEWTKGEQMEENQRDFEVYIASGNVFKF